MESDITESTKMRKARLYLPCMVSNTLSPCCRVPCNSSCFLLFLLLHNDAIKPGWDPSMLTMHLEDSHFLRQAQVWQMSINIHRKVGCQ